MATKKNEVKANMSPSILAIGAALAAFDSTVEQAANSQKIMVNNAYTALKECKTGGEWESLVAGMSKGYATARKCNEAAADKAAQRIVAMVRSEFDLVKPQTAEATKKQTERAVAETEALKAALISGVGADKALEKVNKMAKSDDTKAKATAKAVLAASQVAMASREAVKKEDAKVAEYGKALAVIAAHHSVKVEVIQKAISAAVTKKAA